MVVDRRRPASSVDFATTSRSTRKNWANQGQTIKTHSDKRSNYTFGGLPRVLSERSESAKNVWVTFNTSYLINKYLKYTLDVAFNFPVFKTLGFVLTFYLYVILKVQ